MVVVDGTYFSLFADAIGSTSFFINHFGLLMVIQGFTASKVRFVVMKTY